MSPGSLRAHLAPLALLVTAAILAFSDVVGAERGLFFRDHLLVFKPLWWSVVTQLREGTWPVLSLAHPGGMPLEGSVASGLYTPVTPLLLFGPFDVVYDWFVMVHLPILGAGVYLLALRLGSTRVAAATAAIVAALSGPVLSFENLLVGLQGLAWIPWMGWALVGLLRAPSPRGAALLALAVALHAQGLMPELVVLDLGLFAFLFVSVRPTLDRRLGLALGVAGVLGLALASIDLIPLFEALAGSRRSGGFSASERSGWALSPLQLIDLLAPSFWAPPEIPFLNVPEVTSSAEDPPYLISLYFGCALSLALAAPWRERRVKVMFGLALLALLVAAGARTPLHGWLSALPVLRSGRFAIKYLVVFSALAAALAAMSVARFSERARPIGLFAAAQAVLLVVLLGVSGGDEWRAFLAEKARPLASAGPFEIFKDGDVLSLFVEAMRARLTFALVGAVAIALLCFIAVRRPEMAPLLGGALVVVVALDLGVAGRFTIVGAPLDLARLPEEVARVVGGRTQRVHLTDSPPTRHTEGRTFFEDFIADQARFGFTAFDSTRRYYDPDLDGQGNEVHRRIFGLIRDRPWAEARRVIERAGVRHLIFAGDQTLERVLEVAGEGGPPLRVYRLSRATPYVHAFARWRSVPATPGALWDALRAPEDVGVVIDAADVASHTATTSSCTPAASLVDAASTLERRVVDIDSSCDALVVVQEVPMPRWEARLDGAPAKILTAEVGYQAILAPAGKHRIELVYRSATRQWAWLAGGALTVVIGMLVWRPRRRSGNTGPA
ncbi:MAG: hypothetical protein IT384_07855 [Deltaproteobacteria bacterium]|nr:hypothetical protein [Deltaproteobacteria bacterium]